MMQLAMVSASAAASASAWPVVPGAGEVAQLGEKEVKVDWKVEGYL